MKCAPSFDKVMTALFTWPASSFTLSRSSPVLTCPTKGAAPLIARRYTALAHSREIFISATPEFVELRHFEELRQSRDLSGAQPSALSFDARCRSLLSVHRILLPVVEFNARFDFRLSKKPIAATLNAGQSDGEPCGVTRRDADFALRGCRRATLPEKFQSALQQTEQTHAVEPLTSPACVAAMSKCRGTVIISTEIRTLFERIEKLLRGNPCQLSDILSVQFGHANAFK
jgi:hypothetical protein